MEIYFYMKVVILVKKCFSLMINIIFTDRKLWWADQNLGQLGTCNKKDGRNPTVLRNKTAGVVHMKVYDKAAQQGKLYFLRL